jgi:NitT/TauT family transport system substrate-binding protein
MSITLCEPFRALFYAPFYLPFALDTFRAEGVDVTLTTSRGPGTPAQQMHEGFADVFWGGPMRLLVMRDRGSGPPARAFCEVVTRDPFFLVGARPRPGFELSALQPLRLHTVSEVPTPWMCLQDDLRRAGIDPERLQRVADRTMEQNAHALREGTADVVQLFQPHAEQLIREGTGHLWYAQAARGPCSYTTLYASCDTLERRADDLQRMTRAMYRVQKWLHRASAQEVADAVAGYFPQVDGRTLAGAVERYQALGVWGRTPRLPREGFERLRDALVSGGLIASRPGFADCVDNGLAEAVIEEDPPPA